MRFFLIFICIQFICHSLVAQHNHEYDQKIDFPDIPGYQTLACDFHIHTTFSDGSVWPDIRVQEAVREGLDVIATTDHLEYQPHEDDIPHPDRNRSYEIALEEAKGSDLMVINGSEITRSMPPGHSNAVFIKDANKLLVDDARAAFEEANNQNAFVFWNHPMWSAQRKDGIAKLDPMHKKLIEDGLLHGIEVVNVKLYSDEALQIALDNNLTIMGTSDIHGLTDWEFNIPHGGHRSITLVFAEEHTPESIKQGLMEGRTVVWAQNNFIGLEKYLLPLLKESVVVEDASYRGDTSILQLRLKNVTHSHFILKNEGEFTFHENIDVVTLEPQSVKTLQIKTKKRLNSLTLPLRVMNAKTAPDHHPVLTLEIDVDTANR